ncbi:MAG: 1-acyl-sn-glycerol-3-phosphate acyltransferase [Syntrophobacterales bacterium]|nr:1-acyl-sn-glycerol-3-phosphate acyltransferase [Syntrophobacterales bacterium]
MSIKSKIESCGARIGEYYSGSLYDQHGSPLFRLLGKITSSVRIDEEYLKSLKSLSEEGIVIYALKNKSQLNSLIIRDLSRKNGLIVPVYCHGINMILWQPFPAAFRTFLSRIFHNPYKRKFLKRTTRGKKSSIIYLRGSGFIGSKYTRDPLVELICAQKELNIPIYVVPQLVAYGRKREKKNKTLTDILFSQTENPGMLRRLINFLRFHKKAFVVSSEPINLKEFLETNTGSSLAPETVAYLVRKELIHRIDLEKRSIVGPVLKSREEIIEMVLRDIELGKFIEVMASKENKNYEEVVSRAKKYLFEIAADYNETYIEILDKLLTWLWNDIYDGVIIDREGLVKMRDISRKMPFVVVPCHRSHIDYLFISYVFYHNNIQLPFIAAGTNLLFWPMGHIFRKSGAFFLRRTFKDNILYRKVFEKYIKVLLGEGFPIEFFIEGGRSRTGKMIMPKYGLLSAVIQAYREGCCEDLAIIPIYIGYDRVIEEKSYLKELGGAEKEKEKTSSLFRSRKLLKKRYGSIYLNVGDPIFLKLYLASEEIPVEEMTISERQVFYRKTGYEIVGEINKISIVSPFSLLASGLLSHYRRGISHEDLMSLLDVFYDYLSYKKVRFSSTFANKEKALADALDRFESHGYISKMGPEEDEEDEFEEIIYSVDDDKRMNLEYYKNNILHFFLPISFVAISILSTNEDEIPLSKIVEDCSFLKRLFLHEFIFDDNVDDLEEVNDVLSYIHDKGMIIGKETGMETSIEVKGRGKTNLVPFAGLIQNYIESYWITIRGISYLKYRKIQERDLVKKIQKLGTKMYKKGEISKAEALSLLNFQNAIKFLINAEILSVMNVEDNGKRKMKMLAFTGDKSKADSLRHRVFKFMT